MDHSVVNNIDMYQAKEEKSNAIAAAWEKEKQELQEQLASVNENLVCQF